MLSAHPCQGGRPSLTVVLVCAGLPVSNGFFVLLSVVSAVADQRARGVWSDHPACCHLLSVGEPRATVSYRG